MILLSSWAEADPSSPLHCLPRLDVAFSGHLWAVDGVGAEGVPSHCRWAVPLDIWELVLVVGELPFDHQPSGLL